MLVPDACPSFLPLHGLLSFCDVCFADKRFSFSFSSSGYNSIIVDWLGGYSAHTISSMASSMFSLGLFFLDLSFWLCSDDTVFFALFISVV